MTAVALPYLAFVEDEPRGGYRDYRRCQYYLAQPAPARILPQGVGAFVIPVKIDSISPAQARLNAMTGLDANWEELGSSPPNDTSRQVALGIIDRSFLMDRVRPSYVTASAEGGVGIVYKSDTAYAAIECLNSGEIWMLAYDPQGFPFSRQIDGTPQSIETALDQIFTLHADA